MKQLSFLGLKLSMGNETVTESLKRALPDWSVDIFHFDEGKEAQHHYAGEVDHKIRKYIESHNPNVIIYAGPAEGNCRPMTETFRWMQDKKIKTIAFICDGGCPGWHPAIKEYAETGAFDLMVNGDANPDWPKRNGIDLTTHGLCDPSYFDQSKEKTIRFGAILGLGSARRQQETKWLVENCGLQLGERSEKWGQYQKFADYMCKTFITVNFPEGGGEGKIFQLKYRVLEAGFSRCALFERKNPITKMFFDPNHDYFEYETVEDIPKLLTTSNDEIHRRATNLHRKVFEQYMPHPVWKKMLQRVGFLSEDSIDKFTDLKSCGSL